MLYVRYQNKYIQIVNKYNTYMIEDNIKYYVIIYSMTYQFTMFNIY